MANTTPLLVQKLRLQRGWSQDQLAAVSGLSTRTIQRLETGRPASLETLKAVSSVLEVDLFQLKEPSVSDPSVADSSPRTSSLANDEALALVQVRRIRRFFESLIYFVVIGGAVVVLNILTTPRVPWSAALLVAWAAGLLIAGLQAFGRLPIIYAEWERRAVEKRLGRRL